MGSLLPVAVMTITYSHDIATALLAASGVALWMLGRSLPDGPQGTAAPFTANLFRGITRTAKYSLLWILIAGVPRVYFYRDYEWADAGGGLQVVAILIKHVAMFIIVGTGLYAWVRLRRRPELKRFLLRRNR